MRISTEPNSDHDVICCFYFSCWPVVLRFKCVRLRTLACYHKYWKHTFSYWLWCSWSLHFKHFFFLQQNAIYLFNSIFDMRKQCNSNERNSLACHFHHLQDLWTSSIETHSLIHSHTWAFSSSGVWHLKRLRQLFSGMQMQMQMKR